MRKLLSVLSSLAVVMAASIASAQGGAQPVLELTPNEFPASKVCRRPPITCDQCEDLRYATFSLTYTIAASSGPEALSVVRLSFGYPYRGVYRTERLYNKNYAWPAPQSDDPTAPNYVTARVTGNAVVGQDTPDAFDLRVVYQEARGVIVLRTTKEGGLNAGATIHVTFGDVTAGGPGYLIPATAFEIPLVVEHDFDGDGLFELVDAEVPVLKTIGTEVNSFDVIAPSTPDGNTFDVVVQALDGPELPMSNRYLVPHYRGTIRFTSTDPAAVLPADYAFRRRDAGHARFDVTLSSPGVHTVTVTELATGVSATSNPVIIPTPESAGALKLYWGVLQQHTNIGGHGAQTEKFAYGYGRDTARLDFLTLTEHCKEAFDFEYSAELADRYNEPGRFVTLPGIEWSNREFGHRHIVYRDAADVILPCSNEKNTNYPYVDRLDDLLAGTLGRPALVILHHSAWRYAGPPASTDDVVLGDVTNPNQRLFEIFSHHGSSEKWDNAPYVQHGDPVNQWPESKKVFFQDALAQGYRFGVTAGTDNHSGEPGGHVALHNHYARQGITAVYATELTRDALWDALWNRRTYGTTGARIVLDVRIDGHMMGEAFTTETPPTLTAQVVGTDVIERVEVQRDGYDTVYELAPDAVTAAFEFTDDSFGPGEEHNYYVRVVQRDQHIAWSSPIWVAREGEPPPDAVAFEVIAYPNPFNPSVTVRFALPSASPVTARVITVDGRPVRTLLRNRPYEAGIHEAFWDGRTDAGLDAASGIYFVRVVTRAGTQSARAVLVR